jgi:probable rRNA maturation factor
MPDQQNRPDAEAGTGATTVASPDNYWISVQIAPDYSAQLDTDRLHRLATFTLQAEGRREAIEVGITITNDQEIHTLNKQYLDHDYPTDVLSFGADRVHAQQNHADADEAGEGVEEETVSATEYVTEGYEGDVEQSGADLPLAEEDDSEGADNESAQTSVVQFVTPPGWPASLGDVVISYDTAAMQASDYGHSPAAEVDVLLVHGLLHLLGYDDHDPAERERMHGRQDELLAAFAREG